MVHLPASRCWRSRSSAWPISTSCCARRSGCRSIRSTSTTSRRTSPGTRPSASLTNTNWQFYSGESTMSYLSQMAGLAWHNFVSAAVGIAIAVAVVPRHRAHDDQDARQLLGRPDALLALRLAADLDRRLACCSSGRACRRTSTPYQDVVSIEGFKQTITGGPMASQEVDQGARHQRRRLRQRELRLAEREPDAAQQPARDVLDLLDRRRADVHVRHDGRRTRAKAGRSSPRCRSLFVAGLRSRTAAEAAGNPIVHSLGVAGGNMEGKEMPLRRRRLGAVRHGDDRHVVRRGQLDARLVHAARRPRPAGRHAARRDHLRRRRQRSVRHDRLRRA